MRSPCVGSDCSSLGHARGPNVFWTCQSFRDRRRCGLNPVRCAPRIGTADFLQSLTMLGFANIIDGMQEIRTRVLIRCFADLVATIPSCRIRNRTDRGSHVPQTEADGLGCLNRPCTRTILPYKPLTFLQTGLSGFENLSAGRETVLLSRVYIRRLKSHLVMRRRASKGGPLGRCPEVEEKVTIEKKRIPRLKNQRKCACVAIKRVNRKG
jgi:hypothetical protein